MFAAALVATLLQPTLARADGAAPAAPAVYTTLAERRPVMSLPAYTPDDQQTVAEQAQYFLRDLYVNRERKISIYGPLVDPVPGVADVVANARTMSQETLHETLEHLFTSQHDLHLNYYWPQPFSCYRSFLPFALEAATDPAGNKVIAVKALVADAAVFAVVPEAKKIAVGDVLLSYDGQDPQTAAKALFETGAGANEFGSVRREIEELTMRNHLLHKLPAGDVVNLEFKTREGATYTLAVPWVSKADLTCLGVVTPTGGAAHGLRKRRGVDDFQREWEQLYKPHRRGALEATLTDTPEPSLHIDTINNEFGTFGLIRLDDFEPSKMTDNELEAYIKQLLITTFAQTDGIIIDLRSNGGGSIALAETLQQLFTPGDIQPEGFRLLSTQLNRDIYAGATSFEQSFRDALEVARITGATYTAALPLTTLDEANGLGQFYFKPVAILTNSSCYSACDMFTAQMQDHGIATIYGEDGRTGGGGANVVDHDYFMTSMAPGPTAPFVTLPGKQNLRVAWRQTVRVGKNAGTLIEESGVSADKLATPTLADFFTNDDEQLRLISADLNLQAAQRQSWYQLQVPGRLDVTQGAAVNVPLTAAGTEAVETMMGGVSLGYTSVSAPAGATGTALQVQVAAGHVSSNLGEVELLGYESGNRVWRGIQSFRVVPAATPLKDGDKLAFDFTTANIAPIVVFTSGVDGVQGWSAQGGKLKAGLGDHYPDNMHTEAAIFLDLTARTKPLTLAFDYAGVTEQGYDFFSAAAFSGGAQTDIVAAVSGTLPVTHVTFDLAPFLGKAVELRFTFTSDPGVDFTGPSISNLSVQ